MMQYNPDISLRDLISHVASLTEQQDSMQIHIIPLTEWMEAPTCRKNATVIAVYMLLN